MSKVYFGDGNDIARHPKKIYVGDEDGTARLVKKIYAGDENGIARQVWPWTNLPKAYQEVEYILNTNATEYINLNIKPDSNTRSIIKFAVDGSTSTSTSTRRFFGSYQPYPVYSIGYYNRGGSYVPRFDIDFGNNAGLYSANSISKEVTYEIDFNRNGGSFYIDNTLLGSTTSTFSALSTDLILFGYSNSSHPNGVATDVKYRLYHFQAYQGNTIIRDMFPCYRISDIAVGMFDTVNKVFYENDGTGIFYKGPDVD